MAERPRSHETLSAGHFAKLAESLGAALPEVVAEFHELALTGAREIEQASANADHDAARTAAHRLRGSSMALGAERLRDVSSEIEHIAVAGGGISAELVTALRREIDAAHDAMLSLAPAGVDAGPPTT